MQDMSVQPFTIVSTPSLRGVSSHAGAASRAFSPHTPPDGSFPGPVFESGHRWAQCVLTTASAAFAWHVARRGRSQRRCASLQQRAQPEGLDRIRSYDPKALEDFFAQQPADVALRLAQVVIAGSSLALGTLFDNIFCESSERERRLAGRLREAFIGLGPTFVKLGQTLSCRPDLFSPEVLEEFERLQDNVPAFDNRDAMQLVKDELGLTDLKQRFREIAPAPVAAASLGQVYRARLINGKEVAVKVQRPGAAATIACDLLAARWIARFLEQRKSMLPDIWRDSDLVAVVDEFGARLFEELDYEGEVRNSQRFAKLYGSQPMLKVPKVYPELGTRRVLVMEWINGVKLTDLEGMRKLALDPLNLISINIECSMRQLLEYGFFHADPHPGNFIATTEGELCVLDFGMMCDMTKSARLNLISHVVHFANRDYANMAKDYKRLGFLDESVNTDPIGPELERYFDDRLKNATLASVGFSTIVDGVGEVVFSNYKCSVPAFYALIVRSLVNLEGLALSVDPNYKMLASVYPYFARRILVDVDLRQSLLELLFEGAEPSAQQKGSATRFRWDRVPSLLEASDRAGASTPKAPENAGAWSGDSTIYQDFAGSLSADPVFRKAALQELAKASELFLAERLEEAFSNTDDESVRRAVALEDTDQKSLAEVRAVASALGDRFATWLPSGPGEVARLAIEAAGRFARTGSAPSLPPLPSLTPDLFDDFVQKLRERLVVRALKATSRALDADGSRSTTRRSGDAKFELQR
mmetsp:Transcript_66005/g.157821  ORF Transcript_66005/g.157821 Transcript_66005/m.157821 type:complete len:758 (+) Transcript_66005:77-2350(+)